MRITVAADLLSGKEILSATRTVWEEHPLRRGVVDKALEEITVVVQPARFLELDTSSDPEFGIGVPEGDAIAGPQLSSELAHQLTHIIDRHDVRFTGGRSSNQIDAELEQLPNKRYASVQAACHSFWNAYIDGRLERRGIQVHSLHDSFEEKIGTSRLSAGRYEGHEVAALSRAWRNEPHTFSELTLLAWVFPYFRARESRSTSVRDRA